MFRKDNLHTNKFSEEKVNDKRKLLNNIFFPILIIFAICFLSVGYAAIYTSLEIAGTLGATAQEKVFITNVNTNGNNDAEVSYTNTILMSKLQLSETDLTKTKELNLTIYNNSSEPYIFTGVLFGEEFYSNLDIEFKLNGLEIGDIIDPKETINFTITFSYKEGLENITNSILESTLKFNFVPYEATKTLSGIELNYLIKHGDYAPEGDVYEYYSQDANRLIDNSVKIIVFGKKVTYANEVANLVQEPIDEYKLGTISLYRQQLSDGMYKIYILSDSGEFILNDNSAWMFDKLYKLEKIENLHLLDTSNVTNMRDMFCDCASLRDLDLSNFKTDKVTNMIGMFARMTVVEYLDLTSFNVSNVTEIGQMFTTNTALKKIYVNNNWKLSNSILPEDGAGLFTKCTSLTGGNGTTFNENNITYTMAKIDGSSPGYLTSGYRLANGANVNHRIKGLSQAQINAWTSSTRITNTNVKSITFGKTKDYQKIANNYGYYAIDSDGAGIIRAYRVTNSDNTISVYILSNEGKFIANTDMSWMFDGLIALKEINNLSLLDTSLATNMRDVFCDCQYLENVDLSNFSTERATSLEGMFARMYSMKILDLSNFNTKNVTTIKNMFVMSISAETHESLKNTIPALTTVYVSDNWNVTGILTEEGVFENTLNLVGGNGTTFNENNKSHIYARIDTGSTPGYFTHKSVNN